MENKLAVAKSIPAQVEQDLDTSVDARKAVRDVVRDAVMAKPGFRGLVHLFAAQRAVQGQLDQFKDKSGHKHHLPFRMGTHSASDTNGLGEEDLIAEERSRSLLFARRDTIREAEDSI